MENQEQSEEFQKWFGSSKAVDDEGKPLRVFHGTTGEWENENVFDPSQGEIGTHFGTHKIASGFADKPGAKAGRVYPVYLSLQNPLSMQDPGQWDVGKISDELVNRGVMTQDERNQWQAGFNKRWKEHDWSKGAYPRNKEAHALLAAHGFDSIEYLNRREGITLPKDLKESTAKLNELTDEEFKTRVPEASKSYIAFRPEQIKSAIGNRGTFDPDNPNIGDSLEDAISTQSAPTVASPVAAKPEAAEQANPQALAEGGRANPFIGMIPPQTQTIETIVEKIVEKNIDRRMEDEGLRAKKPEVGGLQATEAGQEIELSPVAEPLESAPSQAAASVNPALMQKEIDIVREGGLQPAKKAIPQLAEGGIVDKTTVAMIGEKGPEAVVPLGGKTETNRHGANEAIEALMMKGEKGITVDVHYGPPDEDNLPTVNAAIAYRQSREKPRSYFVEHFGSDGKVKGTGTELLRRLIAKAKKTGRGIHFVSSPESISYYEKMGFEHTNQNNPEEMGLDKEGIKNLPHLAQGGSVARLPKGPEQFGRSFDKAMELVKIIRDIQPQSKGDVLAEAKRRGVETNPQEVHRVMRGQGLIPHMAEGGRPIDEFEEAIRESRLKEMGGVFTPEGEKVFSQEGVSDEEIKFSPEQMKQMEGNIFTHNHPYEVTPMPSIEDVVLGQIGQASQVRAVTKAGGSFTLDFQGNHVEPMEVFMAADRQLAKVQGVPSVDNAAWYSAPADQKDTALRATFAELGWSFNQKEGDPEKSEIAELKRRSEAVLERSAKVLAKPMPSLKPERVRKSPEKPERERGGSIPHHWGIPGKDSIDAGNAIVAPDEFVVNAESAKANEPLLEKINKSKGPMKDTNPESPRKPVQLAEGGRPDSPRMPAMDSIPYPESRSEVGTKEQTNELRDLLREIRDLLKAKKPDGESVTSGAGAFPQIPGMGGHMFQPFSPEPRTMKPTAAGGGQVPTMAAMMRAIFGGG